MKHGIDISSIMECRRLAVVTPTGKTIKLVSGLQEDIITVVNLVRDCIEAGKNYMAMDDETGVLLAW